MRDIYERVLGPYKAAKHQFVYEDGFPVKENKPIWIVYFKSQKFEAFVDLNEDIVFPRNLSDKTMFSKYMEARPDVDREIYLKAFKPTITKSTRKKGSLSRAFAVYLLDEDKSIFEINPVDVGIGNFYNYVTFNWQISGVKENVKNDNILSLNVAEKELPGMLNFLNPLEFYNEEPTLESKKQSLLERLLHNPHTYGHQSQASNVGSALGLTGTHTMPDGSVMPGSTHQEYLNALRRNQEITTSSGTTIPTQNLRRNSGY